MQYRNTKERQNAKKNLTFFRKTFALQILSRRRFRSGADLLVRRAETPLQPGWSPGMRMAPVVRVPGVGVRPGRETMLPGDGLPLIRVPVRREGVVVPFTGYAAAGRSVIMETVPALVSRWKVSGMTLMGA